MADSPRYRTASLDDIAPLRVDGGEEFTLQWLPVRHELGITAFGTNAYVAEQAGGHVVEPHTEGSGHQELYFVARGRARFTIDGETVDAPAGTYVFLPDGDAHREAVAEEPGTTVMSFGAPEGKPFEVSGWEWGFRAAAVRESDPATARAILQDGLAQRPDSGGMYYEMACLETVEGRTDEALEALATAIRLRADTAQWAREDDDFDALRDDERFRALVG
jgi:quercetin dioxygenase-like cupin family protein